MWIDHCVRLIDPAWLDLYRLANYVIMVAYYVIPGAIILMRRKRPDLIPAWVAWTFASFIILCGTTHLMANLVLDHAWYEAQILFYLATAALSILTALLCWLGTRKILKQMRQHDAAIAATTQALEDVRGAVVANEVGAAIDKALGQLRTLMSNDS